MEVVLMTGKMSTQGFANRHFAVDQFVQIQGDPRIQTTYNINFEPDDPGSPVDQFLRSFVQAFGTQTARALVTEMVGAIKATNAEGQQALLSVVFIGQTCQDANGHFFFVNPAGQWWWWNPYGVWQPLPPSVTPLPVIAFHYMDQSGRSYTQTAQGWFNT
jgi:hypothetical protein